MVSGKEKAPKIDFESDYAAAQEFSVSEIYQTNQGAAAAKAATAPKQKVSEVKQTKTQAPSTGNPEDYLEMAKQVGGSITEAVTKVSNDLVQKALKKGQSKQ